MNDDRIEELLRGTWQPEPPEGMRGRVLARAREETARRRRFDFSWTLGWKPALAALGIVIVLLANMDDNRREARVMAMVGGSSDLRALTPNGDYLRMRHELDAVLASAPFDGRFSDWAEEGDRP